MATVTSATKHFVTAKEGFNTATSGTVASGAATVGLNSVAGYNNGDVVALVIEPTSTTNKQVFTGVVDTSGVQITNVVWTEGTNVTHNAGSQVVDYETATAWALYAKGLLVAHDQSGVHKSGATYASPVFSGTVTGTYTLGGTPTITGPLTVTGRNDGWTTGLPTPNTVTYNGNRNYSLVFNSTDLTSYISNGMKLRATRTVTAPTQCTSLNGTTQYYSKASPSGMTFTDDFTVSAWVKLSSYASGSIASRYNGTSGWDFSVLATGQVALYGFNAGSANHSEVTSYQSLPLNKWVHVTAQLDMSTFTATTTTSYIMFDGVDVPASVFRAGTNPTALIQAGNLEIGSRNSGTNFFPGKIAQVAIYSAKVTQATIQASISQGLSGSETNLISAYSFNNSINDLSANANNLTANGSAVATNVDSPFSGGANASTAYTAGTTDFAEVFNVSFSTNTTVVVQVPDGYNLPTSGGVSALAYSVHSTPLGWPLPGGVRLLGMASLTSNNTTGGTAEADINGLTVTVYVPAGRTLRLAAHCDYYDSSGASYAIFRIKEGSTTVGTANTNTIASNAVSLAAPVAYIYPTAGSHTYKVSFQTSGGNKNIQATATEPAYLVAELV